MFNSKRVSMSLSAVAQPLSTQASKAFSDAVKQALEGAKTGTAYAVAKSAVRLLLDKQPKEVQLMFGNPLALAAAGSLVVAGAENYGSEHGVALGAACILVGHVDMVNAIAEKDKNIMPALLGIFSSKPNADPLPADAVVMKERDAEKNVGTRYNIAEASEGKVAAVTPPPAKKDTQTPAVYRPTKLEQLLPGGKKDKFVCPMVGTTFSKIQFSLYANPNKGFMLGEEWNGIILSSEARARLAKELKSFEAEQKKIEKAKADLEEVLKMKTEAEELVLKKEDSLEKAKKAELDEDTLNTLQKAVDDAHKSLSKLTDRETELRATLNLTPNAVKNDPGAAVVEALKS